MGKKTITVSFFGTFDTLPIDGRMWKLQNPGDSSWGAIYGVDSAYSTVCPPDGFYTDYASIPKALWFIVGPPTGYGKGKNYGQAAVIHDYLYTTGKAKDRYGRAIADKIFLAGMKALHVDRWRRRVMYAAVRAGGWAVYGRPNRLNRLRFGNKSPKATK